MVVQRQPQGRAGILNAVGHVDIRLRRRGVAGGMVVHQNQGRGVQLQRPFRHFSRVDRDMINGALRLLFIRNL